MGRRSTQRERLVVVGQGYVGLPLALAAAQAGYDVVGVEIDERRVALLRDGRSPVTGVADEELARAAAAGRYRASENYADAKEFDIAVVAVPTPLAAGEPDLSHVRAAAHGLAPHARSGCLVILESTSYPGTTEDCFGAILARESGLAIGTDISLAYSPERIDPGNSRWDLRTTPKVVSGVGERAVSRARAFYQRIAGPTVVVSSPRVAEAAKVLENTFRHVNIALVNELAQHLRELDIDIWEVVEAADTKPFGFMRFDAGLGAGGHCIPVDPTYLSWVVKKELGRSVRLIEAADSINRGMPRYVADRIQRGLAARGRGIADAEILVIGLSYKPDVDDVRESPAVRLVDELADRGATLRLHDPHVPPSVRPSGAPRVELEPAQLSWADCVVLAVPHRQVDLETVLGHSAYLFDVTAATRGLSAGDREFL
ncbi:nucleotide sugar dehydrogenase [Actinomadura sp. KC216]|uniref:nucleotide sugar dehydrogenase n=1 Tax=Actinomadura sp. KC216 TaxID=2530370 RepID=UPI001042AC2D|nr:nucleotide sugar dehydrogenase [Actinomadura sp. KC216]TDB90703.1 nucleotide sugar dehydrogenase [Actinomadura sp. KC216]